MLQRINLVLMIIVLIAVGVVSAQVMLTQKYNTLALQDITTQIAQMRFAEGAAQREAAAAPTELRVLVEGDIAKPDWYPITLDPVTLVRDFLGRLGVRGDQWIYLSYPERDSTKSGMKHGSDVFGKWASQIILRPGAEIRILDSVSDVSAENYFRTSIARREWLECDSNGKTYPAGWRFVNDQNMGSRLQRPDGRTVNLNAPIQFDSRLVQDISDENEKSALVNAAVQASSSPTALISAKWNLIDGMLVIEIEESMPVPRTVFRFARVPGE